MGKSRIKKKKMESDDGAAQNLADDEKEMNSEDLDVLNINYGVVESNDESGEYQSDLFFNKIKQAVGITPALESMVEISASGEEAFADYLAEKFIKMELKTSGPDEYKTSCLESEMSSVKDADSQLEASVAEEQCKKSNQVIMVRM